jgi:hypothetical protein
VNCLDPEPSITSIDLGWHQIGIRAGKLLEHLMNGGHPPAVRGVSPRDRHQPRALPVRAAVSPPTHFTNSTIVRPIDSPIR